MIRLKFKRENHLTFSQDFRTVTKTLLFPPLPFRLRAERSAEQRKAGKAFYSEKNKRFRAGTGKRRPGILFFMFVPADFDHLAAGSSPRFFVL